MEKIHYVKIYVASTDNAEAKRIIELKEYDLNGNLISLKSYDDDGNITYSQEFVFDDNGKILKELIYDFEQSYNETKEYKYDSVTGKLIEEKLDYGEAGFSVLKYERKDKTLYITQFDEDGEIEEKTEICFDTQGNILSKTVRDDMENITEKYVNKFDEDGKLIQKQEYDSNNKLEKCHYYFYTASGKISALKVTNAREQIIDWVKIEFDVNENPISQSMMSGEKILLEYPEQNVVIEKYINSAGIEISQKKIIRNEKGNTLEEHSLDEVKYFEYIFY
ncbi:MAG: hypothetical protein WHW07_00050 [Bacteroidales bacterium]|jgi:hypothetical protein|nr:hypothetical protein [Bacteroidales bacterium]HOL97789.1 hypothetical protein [Bacteroidales bacterium]HOM35838.1 hypothetical protein [Bacteroidales bacterium]HPD23243.1 hypothetical protein [Bacteroidales bacterium]HRS99247.1 hypothetical protein [Bacteroidales bacterium]